jgi:hypothetical protein
MNNRKKVTGYINMKKSTKFYLLGSVCRGPNNSTWFQHNWDILTIAKSSVLCNVEQMITKLTVT